MTRLSIEARANLAKGPSSGVCGSWGGDKRHCMRDSGHSGVHEYVDIGPNLVKECLVPLFGYGLCALEAGHDGVHEYEDMEP